MNNIQALKKCRKKAWQEIRMIQNANTMIDVETAIGRAVLTTFGLYNKGLIKAAMRNGYTRLLKVYGVSHPERHDFDTLMRIREEDFNNWHSLIRDYLIDFIPPRLYKTIMYQRLVKGLV